MISNWIMNNPNRINERILQIQNDDVTYEYFGWSNESVLYKWDLCSAAKLDSCVVVLGTVKVSFYFELHFGIT